LTIEKGAAVPAGSLLVAGQASDLAATSLALARRFSAGATLWCLAPVWPQHAHHLAVEFVHPVVVGKRALPAQALTAPDPVAALRTLVTGGDVILAVAAAGDPDVSSVMRRAGAWGAETIWIGVGPRPAPGAADHVLWLDDRGDEAIYGGGFVLVYHLLWELTHVCLEHPGLLVVPMPTRTDEVCITCADEAHLGEVERLRGDNEARVRTMSGPEDIDTTLVGPVACGDLVLVHAGAAIQRVE
jgi:hypothetical protein